jgi:hypothetical protein
VLDLFKAYDVECRDSDQRREQDDGSHVLDHTELVILGIPLRIFWRILVSRQIEQLANIAPGLVSGALMVSFDIVTKAELQNLAAAVVLSLLAVRHLMAQQSLCTAFSS